MIGIWFFEVKHCFPFAPIFGQNCRFEVKWNRVRDWSRKMETNVGQVVVLEFFSEFRIYEPLLRNLVFNKSRNR